MPDGLSKRRTAYWMALRPIRKRVPNMGADDKMQNKGEELGGKVKEGLGKVTGDHSMEADGQSDQAKANVKQAGEHVKDAFKGK